MLLGSELGIVAQGPFGGPIDRQQDAQHQRQVGEA
jgi:hypothetical protein